MVTEEFVTSKLLTWLKGVGWEIVCYDFPQSGTGFVMHPNKSFTKNKGTIIPDIVARKDRKGLLFENKDRFHLGDFNKIEALRTTNQYSESLDRLFEGNMPETVNYGIAFPHFDYQLEKARQYLEKVDFLLTVTSNGEIRIEYNPQHISF